MTSRDFCYWLQGYFELTDIEMLKNGVGPGQLAMIKNHLNMVFKHEIDPSFGNKETVEELHKIHSPEKYTGIESIGKILAGGAGEIPTSILNC